MWKVDIRGAYRHCPVRVIDQLLHCFQWRGKFYVDYNLSFGCRAAPAIWNLFADLICWIAHRVLHLPGLIHWVDDFFGIVVGAYGDALQAYTGFLALLSLLGVIAALDQCGFPMPCPSLRGVSTRLPCNDGLHSPPRL